MEEYFGIPLDAVPFLRCSVNSGAHDQEPGADIQRDRATRRPESLQLERATIVPQPKEGEVR